LIAEDEKHLSGALTQAMRRQKYAANAVCGGGNGYRGLSARTGQPAQARKAARLSAVFLRKTVFVLVCMGLLLAAGCAKNGADAAAEPSPANQGTPMLLSTEPPESTPRLTATPPSEPEMVIDEDGDITLRSDVADSFSATTYSFPEAPTVLIYHTHATEAYYKSASDDYIETEAGRTQNNGYNVVAVGGALADALTQRGFSVIHDTTDVEQPEITSAYSRSLDVMRQYDGIDIYLDLHRNAGSRRGGRSDNTVVIGGTPCAKLFFVVGTGIGTYEGEYDALPDWESNYTFALSVMDAIAEEAQPLVKPIRLKVGRFNQHMGLCLLAEIGTNADTLAAALNTVPYLADALAAVVSAGEAS